jgi:hypothetical protein
VTAKQAWQRGFRTLTRHPWLALLPLAWDLLQMGLAALGIPLGPVADLARMVDHDYHWWFLPTPLGPETGFSFTGFLPTFLPSVSNLRVPVQPESLAVPASLPTSALLASLLLVPALEALVLGMFLGLLAVAIAAPPLSLRSGLRRATRALPGLLIISLATRLGLMLLPVPLLVILTAVIWLFFPLMPLALGARGIPLPEALADAPGQLWNRVGPWLGLGLRTGLTTGAFTLLWSLAGRPTWAALLIYPFLSTALVAAAVALYLQLPAEDEAPEARPARVWWWVLPVAGAGALAGALIIGQWAGFRSTREANFPGPFAPSVVLTVPEGSYEWIIYRAPQGETGLARLARNRFGWKLLWKEEWPEETNSVQPAAVRVSRPETAAGDPAGDRIILWGEIYDQRAAYLEVAGQRLGIGDRGPLFLIPVSIAAGSETISVVDAQGNEVPPREVKQP